MAFVVALNVAIQLDDPDVPAYYEGRPMEEYVLQRRERPGEIVNTIAPVTDVYTFVDDASQRLTDDTIERIRTWSLFGIVALAIVSGLGGYVVSGVMLDPIRDITEVAAEINTNNLNQRIDYRGPDDELKALADTFDSMVARLESSFEQQAQFVQDASHELRTPLAAIHTNIDVLEMTGDGTVEEYKELVQTIKTQTDRLARLTEDLLLLARNEHDGVEIEPVSLQELIREVVRELGPLADRKGVSLRAEGGSAVSAAAVPSMLYRCVLNLADNGIKYSGEGSSVVLRAERTGNRARVVVSDTGPGIPGPYQRYVFDRFYRIDKARNRREGGSGLGLAIVKQLVEVQRGTISLDSEVGRGTTFTLTFPISTESDAESVGVNARAGAGTL